MDSPVGSLLLFAFSVCASLSASTWWSDRPDLHQKLDRIAHAVEAVQSAPQAAPVTRVSCEAAPCPAPARPEPASSCPGCTWWCSACFATGVLLGALCSVPIVCLCCWQRRRWVPAEQVPQQQQFVQGRGRDPYERGAIGDVGNVNLALAPEAAPVHRRRGTIVN